MTKTPTPKPRAKPKMTAPPAAPVVTDTLSAEEFKETMVEVFGGRGWQSAFARGTGIAPSTITRYLQGAFPIPCYICVITEMLLTLRRNGLPVPDRFGLNVPTGE
mgnify:FL=1